VGCGAGLDAVENQSLSLFVPETDVRFTGCLTHFLDSKLNAVRRFLLWRDKREIFNVVAKQFDQFFCDSPLIIPSMYLFNLQKHFTKKLSTFKI
jgi:hypothetical protein